MMKIKILLSISLICSFNLIVAADSKDASEKQNSSRILGMSVTGNKESPRSLTIVPWRSPLLNGETSEIQSVWQPKLKLLDPASYRRNINLYLKQREQ